jgi:hypothetical protein
MRNQGPDFQYASVAELVERLRPSTDPDGEFDERVVLELVRRADMGEELQAQVRSEALRETAPVGCSPTDF